MVDISKITTEQRNPKTTNIDLLSTKEILVLFNEEDKTVPYAVGKALDQIAIVVDVTEVFRNDGRLFYVVLNKRSVWRFRCQRMPTHFKVKIWSLVLSLV